MLSDLINKIYSWAASVPFDNLIFLIWGSFAAVFVVTLIVCVRVPKIRAASKRPFLCLVNAYSAVTAAAFLITDDLPHSVFAAALFWCVGYLAYGLLCLLTKQKPKEVPIMQPVFTSAPVFSPAAPVRCDVPAAKSSVRLEHAISVTDNLLAKNLGKGDRQELEKLRNTLAVLQMKGTLSTAESEILNENFNALLKLMAKYNV